MLGIRRRPISRCNCMPYTQYTAKDLQRLPWATLTVVMRYWRMWAEIFMLSVADCLPVFQAIFSRIVVTDRISKGGNVIASVRPSACPSVCSIFGTDWLLTLNFCVWVDHDRSLQVIEGRGHRSRSRWWVSPISIEGSFVVDWLIVWLIGWLAGRLINRLIAKEHRSVGIWQSYGHEI